MAVITAGALWAIAPAFAATETAEASEQMHEKSSKDKQVTEQKDTKEHKHGKRPKVQ